MKDTIACNSIRTVITLVKFSPLEVKPQTLEVLMHYVHAQSLAWQHHIGRQHLWAFHRMKLNNNLQHLNEQ